MSIAILAYNDGMDHVDLDLMIDAPFPDRTGASTFSTTEFIAFKPVFWRLRGER